MSILLDRDTALLNFEVLRSLPKHTKLYVNNNGKIYLEERWFSGVRRMTDGSSRSDIISPIHQTILRLNANTDVSTKDILDCVDHLDETLKTVYPNFDELFELLGELKSLVESSPPKIPKAPPRPGMFIPDRIPDVAGEIRNYYQSKECDAFFEQLQAECQAYQKRLQKERFNRAAKLLQNRFCNIDNIKPPVTKNEDSTITSSEPADPSAESLLNEQSTADAKYRLQQTFEEIRNNFDEFTESVNECINDVNKLESDVRVVIPAFHTLIEEDEEDVFAGICNSVRSFFGSVAELLE